MLGDGVSAKREFQLGDCERRSEMPDPGVLMTDGRPFV